MDTLEAIRTRRSIRKFKPEPVPEHILEEVLRAGTWAPSGMNNQPWKFVIIQDQSTKNALGELSKYGTIIKAAPVCVAVFLDNDLSYDRVKDIQAIGACLQNMLLAIHSMGMGGVWLGEILKNKEKVRELLKVPHNCELMAVVAFGPPAQEPGHSQRRPLKEVIMARY